ncbi:MAG TPA: sensor histidine kinase [Gaiellaceae bacterium]|jgi:signal transduction histidine kinase|nr:sensor histidine kinase [Gaiellaceae bacterium]
MRLLKPFLRGDTYRALAFLIAAVPMAAAALALFIAGWTTTVVLAITPLVIPVLVGFRGAAGLLSRVDAALARALLRVETHPSLSSGGRWFWGRGKAVLFDARFWKQQVYLAFRMTFGFAIAVATVSLLAASLMALTCPVWYRWSAPELGSWHADRLSRSLLLAVAGALVLLGTVHLVGALGTLSGRIVARLLSDTGSAVPAAPSRTARRRALAFDAAIGLAISALLTLIWALTGGGYYWPEWAILPLALIVGIHGVVELVDERPGLRSGQILTRGFAVHAGILGVLLVFFVAVWALTGAGYFWPIWPMLAAAVLLGTHATFNYVARGSRLERRVGVLEATRSGAVDAQDAELRRIERDLHDGAQARLVALGMSLGMAEQRFASDPESAQQLVAEARVGVGEALQELRDLARGIHPPVLADRGLGAALTTLADRSVVPVDVAVELDRRLPPAVESAAYFVVAESIANASKHSGANRIEVDVRLTGKLLSVEIGDDGHGGADPGGSGLIGLRRRVEALDGRFAVVSPEGGPTTVRVELPCGS